MNSHQSVFCVIPLRIISLTMCLVCLIWAVNESAAVGGDAGSSLANEHTSLSFAGDNKGFACTGIIDANSGQSFVAQKNLAKTLGLWRLKFLSVDQKTIVTVNSLAKAQTTAKKHALPNGSIVCVFRWEALALGGMDNALAVSATVTLLPDGHSEWAIRVDNAHPGFGLYSVDYPILGEIAPSGTAAVVFHGGVLGGTLSKNNRQRRKFYYPSENWSLQFLSFSRNQTGLYIGMHDPLRRPKEARLTAAQDLYVTNFPKAMGKVNTSYRLPYPIVIRLYQGDWWRAAKIYRAWVLQQSWGIKKPLRQRHVPKSFKEASVWFSAWQAPRPVAKIVLAAKKYFAVPMGVFWCEWGVHQFDHHLPDLFPARDHFREVVATLQANGIAVAPYINARVWGSDHPEFVSPEVQRGLALDYTGKNRTELFASKVRLGVMCPAAGYWRGRLASLTNRLLNEIGVNAIYFDQVGAAVPVSCFRIEHGHAPGFSFWVDAYNQLLENTRRRMITPSAIMTESASDGYDFDGELMCWWNKTCNFANAIPLPIAVYGGRVPFIPLVSNSKQTFAAYTMIQGRFFCWGMPLPIHQNEYEGSGFPSAKLPESRAFTRRTARLRFAAKDFMIYGELLGSPVSVGSPATVTAGWALGQKPRRTVTPVTLPAVLSSVWRAENGSLGIALVNLANTEQPYSFRLRQYLSVAAKKKVHLVEQGAISTSESLPPTLANETMSGILAPLQTQFFVLKSPAR